MIIHLHIIHNLGFKTWEQKHVYVYRTNLQIRVNSKDFDGFNSVKKKQLKTSSRDWFFPLSFCDLANHHINSTQYTYNVIFDKDKVKFNSDLFFQKCSQGSLSFCCCDSKWDWPCHLTMSGN